MPMFDLSDTKFILPTASDRPITINGEREEKCDSLQHVVVLCTVC
jgi:hypothetical protein